MQNRKWFYGLMLPAIALLSGNLGWSVVQQQPSASVQLSHEEIVRYCASARPLLLKPVGSYCCDSAGESVSWGAYCTTGSQNCVENLCPIGSFWCQ